MATNFANTYNTVKDPNDPNDPNNPKTIKTPSNASSMGANTPSSAIKTPPDPNRQAAIQRRLKKNKDDNNTNIINPM